MWKVHNYQTVEIFFQSVELNYSIIIISYSSKNEIFPKKNSRAVNC